MTRSILMAFSLFFPLYISATGEKLTPPVLPNPPRIFVPSWVSSYFLEHQPCVTATWVLAWVLENLSPE
jgi:hypothetical protein